MRQRGSSVLSHPLFFYSHINRRYAVYFRPRNAASAHEGESIGSYQARSRAGNGYVSLRRSLKGIWGPDLDGRGHEIDSIIEFIFSELNMTQLSGLHGIADNLGTFSNGR